MSYNEKVIDHYKNPRNVGSFGKDDPMIGSGVAGAPECGDVLKLQLKFDSSDKVVDARFKTYGCGSAIAAGSFVTDLLKGKSITQALEIKNTTISGELQLPPAKLHCSVLAEDAIKAAIEDYRNKKAQAPTLILKK